MRFVRINNFFAGALAAWSLFALWACSGNIADTPLPEETGSPLDFAVAESASRAESASSVFEQEGTRIKVFGLYYDPTKSGFFNLFDGTVVTRTADAWTYEPLRYWLSGFTYDFKAVYPASLPQGAEVVFDKGEGSDCHLNINSFESDGTDLMVASERRVIVRGQDTPRPAVALKFRHILSRVTFSAKTDDRYLGSDGNPVRRLRIVGFKISGIARHGSWVGDSYGKDGSSLGKWTVAEQNESYIADIQDDGIAVGNTPVRLFDGDDIILAIPQTFEAAQAEIEYSYTDDPSVVHSAVAELSGAWLPGKSYSYSFTINAHIFFDTPKVDDWISAPVNGPDLDIKLPL